MEINVSVENVDLKSVIGDVWGERDTTLADAVVDRIVADLKSDEYDLYSGIRQRIKTIRDEEIRAQIAPIIAEAVAKPVQKTDGWGTPNGEPTSLTALIVAEAREQLRKPVDQYNNRQTMVQKLIADEVNKALSRELMAVVGDEKEKVVAAVRAKAAELIADAVKHGIGR